MKTAADICADILAGVEFPRVIEGRCPVCGETYVNPHYAACCYNKQCRNAMKKGVAKARIARGECPKRQRPHRPKYMPLDVRKCHDCGKPTPDYRCPACQAAFREKNNVTWSDTVADEAWSQTW